MGGSLAIVSQVLGAVAAVSTLTSSKKSPQAPNIPPAPAAPTTAEVDQTQKTARDNQAKVAASAVGRGDTILGPALGVPGDQRAAVTKKTILGL